LLNGHGCASYGRRAARSTGATGGGLRRPQAANTLFAMRWVLHGSLTGAVAEALRRHGDVPHAASELGPAATVDAGPRELLKAAQSKQLDVMTNDPSLINAIFEDKISFNRAVVFLQLAGGDLEQDDAIDRLFARYKRLSPGRLYTVTGSRVKVRQLPGRK
jgi:hypothetical protein